MEFTHELECPRGKVSEAIYPPSTLWNAIVHQYTKGKKAVLEMATDLDIDCSITFRSSDRATLKLYYTHHTAGEVYEIKASLEERLPEVFSQASQTIRDHPLLASVKHLSSQGRNVVTYNPELVTNAIG